MLAVILMLASGAQINGCPSAIRDTQTVIADKSWSVFVRPGERVLDGATVYSGNPSKRRSLKPVPKGDGAVRWAFAGEDIWVECRYMGSSAVLKKNLGPLKSCIYTPSEGGTDDPASLLCEKKT